MKLPAFVWIPILALVDTVVIELFNHKAFTSGLASMIRFFRYFPLAFLVNFFMVLVTLAPAFFLRRRVFWCALVSAVWIIAGGVNGFILMSRMTPFTTADLTVLNTGLDTLPNYMSTGYIVLLGIALVGLLVGLVLLAIRGPKSREPLRRRMVTGLLALAVSGGALAGVWVTALRVGQLSTTFPNLAFAYEDYGFPYCFLETWLNKGIREPVNYSSADVTRIRQEIEKSAPQKTDPQTDVNVVYVQLESFMDPSEIQGLQLNQDAVPTWHALEKNFTSGYLRVPVVGAGTANTEFEVLTGMSSRLFGPGEYPYKTCLQDNAIESIAYDLKALGYAAHAIHNHRATFYTRNTVYANLGFDDFTSLEYMPWVQRTPRGWCKDYVLTDQIAKALDSTENQSDVVFTVSVQGHGSYPTEKVIEDPAITVEACPGTINANAVEYYANQIYEMDQFISELIKALSDRGEKTMLILYGDHLPSLNLEGTDMKSGSLYKTKYVIWNNFGLPQKDQDINAYQLSAEALGEIGISDGLMLKFQKYCRKDPTYRADLQELQYDVLYGRSYLYDGESPYTPADMKMGFAKIKIQGMYQRDDVWYVRGENFSPYCKITVDGKILDTTYVNPELLRIDEDPGTSDYQDLVVSVVDMHKEVLSDTE
ncbi:MAG: LTA synthase family protein [Oscillibacter sp.]|nr:LTA synthase family protein [Oscillibacter sp.]